MKTYIKDIILVLVISLAILLIAGLVDFILYKNKKDPIFCNKTDILWDGGSYECYGSFYKIDVKKTVESNIKEEKFQIYNLFKKD